ncbi:MAG: YbjN domain-containing protein [Alphaproteobacteria bacterium]|nr:YbjN domain-containing protein [Alphaproteobacteria bacterium]
MNTNVIDLIEIVATKIGWQFFRTGDSEISVILTSENVEYHLLVEMRQEVYEALYFSCDVDIEIQNDQYQNGAIAIVKANEHSWLGHFDIISTNNHIMYSLTIPFASSFNFDEINVESILTIILDECSRFQQYFSMAINSNDVMSDLSINTLFFEALGEA